MPHAVVGLGVTQLAEVEALLRNNGLPFEDCAAHIDNFVGVFDQGELVAVGGIEVAGTTALLRSLVVRVDYRGRGLAGLILNCLHARSLGKGLGKLYLLTETAAPFFSAYGYRAIARSDLPGEIRATREFLELCPDSAQAMQLELQAKPS